MLRSIVGCRVTVWFPVSWRIITTCCFQNTSIVPASENNDQISLVTFADSAVYPLPSSPNQINNRTSNDNTLSFRFHWQSYGYKASDISFFHEFAMHSDQISCRR